MRPITTEMNENYTVIHISLCTVVHCSTFIIPTWASAKEFIHQQGEII